MRGRSWRWFRFACWRCGLCFEERFLRRELAGYEAYTEKVRYRLVPYLW